MSRDSGGRDGGIQSLDARRTAHAIAICGTALNALRVTRTGAVSMEGPRGAIRSVGKLARRFLDAGVYQVMIESEGITENVRTWR